jgi:DNA polymerase I
MIGIDVETTALSPDEGKLRLVQLSNGKKARVYDAFRQDPDMIRRDIQEQEELVAHNAPFERTWLRAALGVDRPDLHDTMVMSQVLYTGTRASLNKSFSHSLASVVKRELKRELNKEEQTSDWSATGLTREQIQYAAIDAAVLPELAEVLLKRIDRAGLRKVYELERRVSHAIDAMERRGVAMHRDRLEEMIAETTEEAARLKSELEEEWGINPGSSKQLREYFKLDEREDWPQTKGGSPSTDKESMKSLLGEDPSIKKWVEWKKVEKIRSTYGTSILKKLTPEGRLHARFLPFGTVTGRFSSSSPNLQNIPKRGDYSDKIRSMFWSGSDDRVLIKADYASIELWVAAVVWEDPRMQHALQSGINMHVSTAAALFNVKPEEVTKEQKATGKIVNFALLYGGSPNRILQEFMKNNIPIDMRGAEEMHAKFFKSYTGFYRRREEGRKAWNDHVYRNGPAPEARTVIGRRRAIAEWYGPFLNHEIQGTATGDGIKYALARIYEDRAAFPDAHLVLTVHDEIVVEAPEDQQDEVAAWVEHHMVEGMLDALQKSRDDVPSLPIVEIDIGKEWS